MAPTTPKKNRPQSSPRTTPAKNKSRRNTPGSAQNKEGREEKEQKMAGSWRRDNVQFGDMPVPATPAQSAPVQSTPVMISLEREQFRWSDEVFDEALVVSEAIVQDDLETSETEKDVPTEDTTDGPSLAGDSIVQTDLETLKTEIDVPEQDNQQGPEYTEEANVQDSLETLESEMEIPEETSESPEQVTEADIQNNLEQFETEMNTPGKDTIADSEQTDDTIVPNSLETASEVEVATRENLMEDVKDTLGTSETQSLVTPEAVEASEVLNIVEGEHAQNDLEPPEHTDEPTKDDMDTLSENLTPIPLSKSQVSFVPNDLDSPESTLKAGTSLDGRENGEPSQTKEPIEGTEEWWNHKEPASKSPVINLPSSPKQSTGELVESKPAISYAKIAAAAAAAFPEPVSMGSDDRKDVEKASPRTPVKAQLTPTRSPQSSRRIIPVIPRSFERQNSTPVSPVAGPAVIAAPCASDESGWESVPAEAYEKQQEWNLQTPKRARKTPRNTPSQSAQAASSNGDEDEEQHEVNTPASPSPTTPYTPTKSKPKRRRPLSKAAKAAKAAQAQALPASLVHAVETEISGTEVEAGVKLKKETTEVELPKVIETKNLKFAVDIKATEAKVYNGTASAIDVEVERVEAIAHVEDETVQPVVSRSSVLLFIAMLLVALILYSVIFYMPDIFEYLKESLVSDTADL
ncbi:hypothetical protein ONS95_003694 [Cadophora gregata]|uniref:uncharacterized protein n=1 Tax=Cadophora gregata TaxID=51156 RepID=UPI0026DD4192|nr:uncharacterized protein ONS95_003694 [Cadophora gregata]KAK0106979.1 hypothetical protein ONS95_003694 [Cadophora gregata]